MRSNVASKSWYAALLLLASMSDNRIHCTATTKSPCLWPWACYKKALQAEALRAWRCTLPLWWIAFVITIFSHTLSHTSSPTPYRTPRKQVAHFLIVIFGTFFCVPLFTGRTSRIKSSASQTCHGCNDEAYDVISRAKSCYRYNACIYIASILSKGYSCIRRWWCIIKYDRL